MVLYNRAFQPYFIVGKALPFALQNPYALLIPS
jgi:hypothetical protein